MLNSHEDYRQPHQRAILNSRLAVETAEVAGNDAESPNELAQQARALTIGAALSPPTRRRATLSNDTMNLSHGQQDLLVAVGSRH